MGAMLRLPMVVLLFFCAVPSRVDAQQFVCWPISRGDTASGLARRLTGDAAAAYSHTFQIRDPARRMFVPKSRYQRLQLDWQACLARSPLARTPRAYAPVVALAASALPRDAAAAPNSADSATALASAREPVAPTRTARISGFAVTPAIGGALLLVLLLSTAAGTLASRPIPPSVRRAGVDFVTLFAKPLVDESTGAPPIRMRLKFRRRTQQLEISLAPGAGRRYPNLADHKKNLEYDVDRVMHALGNHYVLTNPLRAAGKWVVVTIGPADTPRQPS